MSAATIMYAFQGGGGLDTHLDKVADRMDKVRLKAVAALNAVKDMRERHNERMDALAEQAESAAGGIGAVIGAMGLLAVATHAVMQENKEYSNSVAHLADELGRLRDRAAETFGEKISTAVDVLSVGIVYLANLISNVLGAAINGVWMMAEDLLTGTVQIIEDLRTMWRSYRDGTVINLDPIIKHAKDTGEWLLLQMATTADEIRNELTWDDSSRAFSAAFAAWKRQATDIVTEVGDGKKEVAKEVAEVQKDTAKAVTEAIKSEIDTIRALNAEADALVKRAQADTMEFASGELNQLMTGDMTATLTVLAGPLGTLVGTVLDFVENLPQIATSILNEVLNIYLNLDEWVGEFLSGFVPAFIRAIPLIVAGFATLIPEILFEVIQAVPFIASAFVEAIITAIPVIMAHVKLIISELVMQLTKGLSPFGKDGRLGTNLGSDAEVKRILGVKVPFLDSGGVVMRTGLVVAHRGERYEGVGRAAMRNGGSRSGTTINIGAVVSPDPRRTMEEFRYLQGTTGIGLRSDTLVRGS